MAIDVDRARSETPGIGSVVHLNNAGAALPSRTVLRRQLDHLWLEATKGGYEAARAVADDHDAVYASIARLIGAAPDEIALTDSATRAWHLAFHSFAFEPGDRIVTARAEYATGAISFLQAAARTGVEIEVVPDDQHGQVDLDALADALDDRVKLIALTHVPTQGGLVNPAAAVGALAREAGIAYLLDACQSVGQLPIDVDDIGCDLLSATGRKWLRAPRGTGFLYVRSAILDELDPPFLDLHSATWDAADRYTVRADARRFESWEHNVAAALALGAAVDEALGWGLDDIAERVATLADDLRARLSELDGVTVHDLGEHRCGIVTFTVAGREPVEIQAELEAAGVNVSVTTAASARYDLDARGVDALVRASPHYYNDESDLDALIAGLSPSGGG